MNVSEVEFHLSMCVNLHHGSKGNSEYINLVSAPGTEIFRSNISKRKETERLKESSIQKSYSTLCKK